MICIVQNLFHICFSFVHSKECAFVAIPNYIIPNWIINIIKISKNIFVNLYGKWYMYGLISWGISIDWPVHFNSREGWYVTIELMAYCYIQISYSYILHMYNLTWTNGVLECVNNTHSGKYPFMNSLYFVPYVAHMQMSIYKINSCLWHNKRIQITKSCLLHI